MGSHSVLQPGTTPHQQRHTPIRATQPWGLRRYSSIPRSAPLPKVSRSSGNGGKHAIRPGGLTADVGEPGVVGGSDGLCCFSTDRFAASHLGLAQARPPLNSTGRRSAIPLEEAAGHACINPRIAVPEGGDTRRTQPRPPKRCFPTRCSPYYTCPPTFAPSRPAGEPNFTMASASSTPAPAAAADPADAGGAEGPWYFAYGANMDEAVFVKRRQIQPRRAEAARIDTHALCFNVAGVPYDDPGQGGVRKLTPRESGPGFEKHCVHGVAYLLGPGDLARIVASEGYVEPFSSPPPPIGGWPGLVVAGEQKRAKKAPPPTREYRSVPPLVGGIVASILVRRILTSLLTWAALEAVSPTACWRSRLRFLRTGPRSR